MEDLKNNIQNTDPVQKKITDDLLKEFETLKNKGSKSFLADWTAVKLLGFGSWGSVYKAERANGTEVEERAIKIIKSGQSRTFDDFYNEVRILQDLEACPNIAKIRDCAIIKCNSSYYLAIAMDCLTPIVSKDNPPKLTRKEINKLANDICDALSYCHSQVHPIIHCDIKPDNILKDKDGNYCLSDFGEAKHMRRTGSSSYGPRGTPKYMAPEVLSYFDKGGENPNGNGAGTPVGKRKPAYDHRADIYSLGCTLYALFNNGSPPFWDEFLKSEYYKNANNTDGISMALAFRSYKQERCNRLVPVIKGVPKGLMRVIRRMCLYAADERFSSIDEVKKMLNSSPKEQEGSWSYLHVWRNFLRAVSRAAIVLAIAGALAAAAFGLMFIQREYFVGESAVTSDSSNITICGYPAEEQDSEGYGKKLYRVPFTLDPRITEDSFDYVREDYSYVMYTQHITTPRYWNAALLISCLENGVEADKEYYFTIVTTDEVREIYGTKADAIAEIRKKDGDKFTGIAVTEPEYHGTNACSGAYLEGTNADEYFSSLPAPSGQQP